MNEPSNTHPFDPSEFTDVPEFSVLRDVTCCMTEDAQVEVDILLPDKMPVHNSARINKLLMFTEDLLCFDGIAFDEVRPSEEHDGHIHITMWIQRHTDGIRIANHLRDLHAMLKETVLQKWPPDLSSSDGGSDDDASKGGVS